MIWNSFTMERFGEADFSAITPKCYGDCFASSEILVFVGSCGIAVRKIAPYVHDKRTDPAVVCVDELGTFVIPLLSGHIGGANALAVRLARAIQAQPVVTTATDVERKFSVDTWAAERNLHIGDFTLCKAVSAGILEENVPICSQYPLPKTLPAGLVEGTCGKLGIYVGLDGKKPFDQTLVLTPRVLTLGIGCRKGTPETAIEEAVAGVLASRGLPMEAVEQAASIDLKAGEAGLLSYCEQKKIPIRFYTAEELGAVPGEFTTSAFVSSVTGVDNVCERAAARNGDPLIVRKTACRGVTVAVSRKKWEVTF